VRATHIIREYLSNDENKRHMGHVVTKTVIQDYMSRTQLDSAKDDQQILMLRVQREADNLERPEENHSLKGTITFILINRYVPSVEITNRRRLPILSQRRPAITVMIVPYLRTQS